MIALPTTAGTAAEVTINYVITDEENVKKMVCVDPNDIPTLAVIDPELMLSMPRGLTAATGMDALTHAIEGLITLGAWEMSDMFELKAIEMIAKWLPKAVETPSDIEARDAMATAQYIAGMAFSNVGLGLVHGMAHPLGAFYDIPHGVANALLLPYVMEFNMPAAKAKYRKIAGAMGVDTSKMSEDQAAQAAVDAVKALSVRINIPQKLSELGVKESDLGKLAQSAFNDVCTPGNPRKVTLGEIEALYKKRYKEAVVWVTGSRPYPGPGLLRLIRGIAGGEVLKIMEVYSSRCAPLFYFPQDADRCHPYGVGCPAWNPESGLPAGICTAFAGMMTRKDTSVNR